MVDSARSMAERSDAPADTDALAADIATRYFSRLRMFALRRLRVVDEAEDAAQETLQRVLVALREGRVLDMQALSAYVFETARHVCAHRVRHWERTERAFARLADVDAPASSTADPLSALITEERLRQ